MEVIRPPASVVGIPPRYAHGGPVATAATSTHTFLGGPVFAGQQVTAVPAMIRRILLDQVGSATSGGLFTYDRVKAPA